MNIRNKLILVLITFSIIPVTTLVVFEIKRDQKTLEKQIGISSLEFSHLALRRINEYLKFKLEDVQGWRININHKDIATGDESGSLSSYFKRLSESCDEYYYIIALNKEGRIVSSSDVKLVGAYLDTDTEVQRVLEGNMIIQDVSFNRMAGGYAIVFSAPILDKGAQAETVGVVSAALRWDKLNEMISDLKVGGEKQDMANHFMLTNKEGLVISCFDNEQMFSTNLIGIGLKSAKYAQEHREGSLVETSEHGISSFSTYTYMKESKNIPLMGWLLILYQDTDRVFAPVSSLKMTMLYILPATIVLLIIFSFYFANKISKPILSLALIAKNIGDGDLTKEVKFKGKDEISRLADSFNKMRVKLSTSFENIERHRKELQVLSKRIVIVQEEERKKLSLELHDEAGQALVALKINLEIITKLIPTDATMAHKRLGDSKALLLNTINDLRNMSFFLRPTILDQLGLADAIEAYAGAFSARANISVKVRSDLESKRFQQDVELSFYRMVQEALTNILKHSEANVVQIEICCENNGLTLRVKDNGNGFDIAKMMEGAIVERRVGLLGMRERFTSIGASLNICSVLGEGTELMAKYQTKS